VDKSFHFGPKSTCFSKRGIALVQLAVVWFPWNYVRAQPFGFLSNVEAHSELYSAGHSTMAIRHYQALKENNICKTKGQQGEVCELFNDNRQ
jgi:hypothetical protein